MSDVSDFEKARAKREAEKAAQTEAPQTQADKSGWLQGPAQCLSCDHRWNAVAPAGQVFALECPACHLKRGTFSVPFERSCTRWFCQCGSDRFQITDIGASCIGCGLVHDYAQISCIKP